MHLLKITRYLNQEPLSIGDAPGLYMDVTHGNNLVLVTPTQVSALYMYGDMYDALTLAMVTDQEIGTPFYQEGRADAYKESVASTELTLKLPDLLQVIATVKEPKILAQVIANKVKDS